MPTRVVLTASGHPLTNDRLLLANISGVMRITAELVTREVLIKLPGSSVHPRVPCGLCFLSKLNQSFPSRLRKNGRRDLDSLQSS
jgi:hypothetical protein